jgi:hypothetical protein
MALPNTLPTSTTEPVWADSGATQRQVLLTDLARLFDSDVDYEPFVAYSGSLYFVAGTGQEQPTEIGVELVVSESNITNAITQLYNLEQALRTTTMFVLAQSNGEWRLGREILGLISIGTARRMTNGQGYIVRARFAAWRLAELNYLTDETDDILTAEDDDYLIVEEVI